MTLLANDSPMFTIKLGESVDVQMYSFDKNIKCDGCDKVEFSDVCQDKWYKLTLSSRDLEEFDLCSRQCFRLFLDKIKFFED